MNKTRSSSLQGSPLAVSVWICRNEFELLSTDTSSLGSRDRGWNQGARWESRALTWKMGNIWGQEDVLFGEEAAARRPEPPNAHLPERAPPSNNGGCPLAGTLRAQSQRRRVRTSVLPARRVRGAILLIFSSRSLDPAQPLGMTSRGSTKGCVLVRWPPGNDSPAGD